MIDDLDQAIYMANEPAEVPLVSALRTVHTGRKGRPRKEIDQNFLEYGLRLRGPTRISEVLGCSRRTVRWRALELGLVQPMPPVFQDVEQADGTVIRHHTTATVAVSVLTDEEIIEHITNARRTFPNAGLIMLGGYFRDRGHNVPRTRITAALLAIDGVPGVFGGRQIVRRVYRVPGPNSLWHHDGQHGTLH